METGNQDFCWVDVDELVRSAPFPPRRAERPAEDLVSSIRLHGLISPLLARPSGAGKQVVCGHRRLLAARAAGIRRVPVLVRALGDVEAIRCYLSENNCRRAMEDGQIEEALGLLRRLRDAGELAGVKARELEPIPRSAAVAAGQTLFLEPGELTRSSWRQRPGDAEAVAAESRGGGSRIGARARGRAPGLWEVDDLVERTREFFATVRHSRSVDAASAFEIVDELIGMQRDGPPLSSEDVYRVEPASWLAPHSVLVASLNLALAPVGCDDAQRRLCTLAGLLHDAGMVFFERRDYVGSPGALSALQRAELRRHTWIGHALLSSLGPELAAIADAARDHHERPDGSGYPQGLHGDAIDSLTRITAVTDVYAALIGPRPYRSCLRPSEALDCLVRNYGFGACDVELAIRLERWSAGARSGARFASGPDDPGGLDPAPASAPLVPEMS